MRLMSLTVTLCLSLAVMPAVAESRKSADTYEKIELLMNIFEKVRAEYVEEVDDGDVLEAAINGMMQSLDPHSSYLGPETYEAMRVNTRGEYGGLGLEVVMENGVIKVVSPFDGTPADRAGLEGGDFITHIDGEPILGLTQNEAVQQMRGPVGTTITVTVIREGEEAPFDVDIVRENIVLPAVRHRVERDSIGYIRLAAFNEQSSIQMREAVEAIQADLGDQLSGFVLDLRSNPGGLLDEAISVSDMFLERGEIVSTKGRRASETSRYDAKSGDLAGGLPIVVLVNAQSASASEIVAGALQDHRRATVLGERTFGKGTVQTLIPLGADSAIRLTTARYYTPSGRSIQERGIEPDILVEQVPGARVRREENLRNHLRNEEALREEEAEQAEDADAAEEPQAPQAQQSDTPQTEPQAEDAANDNDTPLDRQLERALDHLQGLDVAMAPTEEAVSN